ncbi:MAG: methionyl-tRNA formyltransferase [Holosporaceae bacterium]|jgi:methionyl-tRNA formyltransferase|nr:methionyl-tRNA formyltransferase [Holosporaceae bacterium]
MKNRPIVFLGTSSFSLKTLAALCKARFNVVGVYSRAPKPAGRSYKVQKSVVHEYADEMGIPVYCPKNFKSDEEIDQFRALGADLAILSSYGLIIPQVLLNIPSHGFINVHASLLPRWRGAAPIRSAILAGDDKTGITVMRMDAGVDTGEIISMKSVDIFPETCHGELANKLGELGAEMILETLDDLDLHLSRSRQQPLLGISYSKKISKDLCRICWNDSVKNILRHIKAFSPEPASWTEIDLQSNEEKRSNIRLKVYDAKIVNFPANAPCGLIHENMIVSCQNGALWLTEVQADGKNRMSGDDFLRGRRNLVGKIAR